MRPDLYTKVVLTVIAGCLVWLCIQPAVAPIAVRAQNSNGSDRPQKVTVVGWEVQASQAGLPVVIHGQAPEAGPLRVDVAASSLKQGAVPVNLVFGSVPKDQQPQQ